MSLRRRTAELAARAIAGGLNALGGTRPLERLMMMVGERLRLDEAVVLTRHGPLRFCAANEVTHDRVETLFTKEPETIAWIDGLGGGVLYDLGANVGTYALYAALSGDFDAVIALEPESQNFARLNYNIALNRLDGKVTAYPIAVSDRSRLDLLHLSALRAGGANHTLGAALDFNGNPRKTPFRQGAVSYSLDDLIATHAPPFPNHIKIDVDGLEPEIVAGASKTLSDPRVRSLLIEINEALPKAMGIVETLRSLGFDARRNDHARMSDDTEYGRLYNYVFVRGAARRESPCS